MTTGCNFAGCTFAETGTCALERDPATCDHRIASESTGIPPALASATLEAVANDSRYGIPVLTAPIVTAAFPSSRTLGLDAMAELMARRYVTVVGILGDPESGKTACLASLYLLVANAQLTGWSFADSQSLMGFEEIARGAREWNQGEPPVQMTAHTELSDDRQAGFLHLALTRDADGRRVDLALPDLPGEWTTSLVTTANDAPFAFMQAADVIWLVVDGRSLTDRTRRQGAITRLAQLAGRLKTMYGERMPRVIAVITHRDTGPLDDTVISRLQGELAKRAVTTSVVQVAPFSEELEVAAGFGLVDLVEATVSPPPTSPEFWPNAPTRTGTRCFASFRRSP